MIFAFPYRPFWHFCGFHCYLILLILMLDEDGVLEAEASLVLVKMSVELQLLLAPQVRSLWQEQGGVRGGSCGATSS